MSSTVKVTVPDTGKVELVPSSQGVRSTVEVARRRRREESRRRSAEPSSILKAGMSVRRRGRSSSTSNTERVRMTERMTVRTSGETFVETGKSVQVSLLCEERLGRFGRRSSGRTPTASVSCVVGRRTAGV